MEGRARFCHGSTRAMVRVLEARRGSVPQDMALADFMKLCEAYFDAAGCIVDQPFQPRLPDGMIRCYMGADKVIGFGHQLIKALIPPPPEGPDSQAAQPGPRIMHGASAPAFQALRTKMEMEWTPQMMRLLDIDPASLPIIWDADFLYGPRTAAGEDTYVLCEINVSSVAPFPDQAPEEIARTRGGATTIAEVNAATDRPAEAGHPTSAQNRVSAPPEPSIGSADGSGTRSTACFAASCSAGLPRRRSGWGALSGYARRSADRPTGPGCSAPRRPAPPRHRRPAPSAPSRPGHRTAPRPRPARRPGPHAPCCGNGGTDAPRRAMPAASDWRRTRARSPPRSAGTASRYTSSGRREFGIAPSSSNVKLSGSHCIRSFQAASVASASSSSP